MKKDSRSEKAYSELRKKILSSQLTPKTRLKEDEWALKLGISRMAIREALSRLQGEQLVTIGEKGGYFVRDLSNVDIRQIRELREILEIGAIKLLIKKLTKQKIEKLEKICNDYTNMYKENYLGGALEADIKFHEAIIEFAENEKLIKAYKQSHIPLFHQKMGKSVTLISEYEITDHDHRQIVKAIKDKKPKLAEDWLIKHFERGDSIVSSE